MQKQINEAKKEFGKRPRQCTRCGTYSGL